MDRDTNAAKNILLKNIDYCEIPPVEVALVEGATENACEATGEHAPNSRPPPVVDMMLYDKSRSKS